VRHERYKPVQQRLFSRSFDLTGEPSATRAARAVLAAAQRPVGAPAMVPWVQPTRIAERPKTAVA